MKISICILFSIIILSSLKKEDTLLQKRYEIALELSDQLITLEVLNEIPNIDSVSFIRWGYEQRDIYLPQKIENLIEVGIEIDIERIEPGDLIFFKVNSPTVNHVGIFLFNHSFAEVEPNTNNLIQRHFNALPYKYEYVTSRRVTESEVVRYVLERMHIEQIHQSDFVTYVVESGYHNEDFGFLRFYTQDVDEKQLVLSESKEGDYDYGTKSPNQNVPLNEVKLGIIDRSKNYKRPYKKKSEVAFITIHDAGDNKAHALHLMKEVTQSTRPVSWHFSVDDIETYQHVPLDEMAYHAGDGREVDFKLTDTGVPFTTDTPELEFNTEDHHLYINKIKSELMAPMLEGTEEYCHDITPAGLYTEKGENGNYYINAYYANTDYKKVSNRGGNRNSIGIETCIYNGVTYSRVMRRTANLVAHLLNVYHLTPRRVLQHNNFSGKNCPWSMRAAKENTPFAYKHFMELVNIEYFIVKYLPEVKFTYVSHNPELLSNEGYLLKYVTEKTEVSYDVTVEYAKQKVTKTYKTIIYPKEE